MTTFRQPDADFALAVEGDDEPLPMPGEHDPAWYRNGRRPAALLIALAVAGGFAVHATSGGASGPTAHRGSDTPQPARVRYVEASQVPRPMSGLVSDDLTDRCPAGATCRTSTELPDDVGAALRAAFGAYDSASARTVTTDGSTPPRLIVRFVHVVTGSADVTVQVFDDRLRDSATVNGSGSAAIAVVQRVVGASTVRVTVGGPGASVRTGSPTLRLVADPRLLRLT